MTNAKIHDLETDEIIERELTALEIAQAKLDHEEAKAKAIEIEEKATAKADLLAKLGITAEEAALLLA